MEGLSSFVFLTKSLFEPQGEFWPVLPAMCKISSNYRLGKISFLPPIFLLFKMSLQFLVLEKDILVFHNSPSFFLGFDIYVFTYSPQQVCSEQVSGGRPLLITSISKLPQFGGRGVSHDSHPAFPCDFSYRKILPEPSSNTCNLAIF